MDFPVFGLGGDAMLLIYVIQGAAGNSWTPEGLFYMATPLAQQLPY